MFRCFFVIILSVLFLKTADAQKALAVYCVKNSGKTVSTKDSADYFLVIMPPDATADKNLFVVKGFYPNGKIKMIMGSLTNDLPLKLSGAYIEFFPNGHKRTIRNFDNGKLAGDVLEYYPNGRFYNKKYVKTLTPETELQFKDCSDSTGKVLAENGEGNWITFNDDFTKIAEKGKIKNSLQDSVWTKTESGNISYTQTYKDGKVVVDLSSLGGKIFTAVENAPEFPGGIDAFIKYLSASVRYPS